MLFATLLLSLKLPLEVAKLEVKMKRQINQFRLTLSLQKMEASYLVEGALQFIIQSHEELRTAKSDFYENFI